MKKKAIFGLVIFIVLLLSIVFANSYERALERGQSVNYCNNNYNCEQYENCPIYNDNGYCPQQNYRCRSNCGRQQGYAHTMCHK